MPKKPDLYSIGYFDPDVLAKIRQSRSIEDVEPDEYWVERDVGDDEDGAVQQAMVISRQLNNKRVVVQKLVGLVFRDWIEQPDWYWDDQEAVADVQGNQVGYYT